jgi:RHS repeat-associated protein
VSYDAGYFDDADRPIASEDVGTNGGSAWTRPSTPDASDATHLVDTTQYGPQGMPSLSIDPRGIKELTVSDMLGQTTETIAAYTGSSASDMDVNASVTDATPTSDTNQTTDFTFDGDGDETSQTAIMPSGTPSQTTAWIFGVTTTGGSTLNSNDILAKEEFPNATTGAASTSASDDISYTVDNLGEALTMTDQNGTTHSYGRDLLGRTTSDSVTVLGSGVDGTVRLHTIDYNEQGSVYQMTAYADTGGMTLVNQVQDGYNGLGQLTDEYQADSGAVVTSGPTPTPQTQYAYSDPSSGSLMTAMTYPNGRVLDYGRDNNALDTALGRVDYLADAGGSASGHLVDYLYLGAGTIVQQADANGVKLTYLQQSGDSSAITSGDQYAGDPVTGLDRFGQVIDQNWVNTTTTPTPTTTDRFQYGYDQGGDVLYSNNLLQSSQSELYHSNSTTSGDDNSAYDPLARLTAFARGALSASSNNSGVLDTISSPSETHSFTLDAVGNQTAVTTSGTTVANTTNAKNELTANGANDLAFDANGNTTTDQSGNILDYDAWNHIADLKNSSSVVVAAYSYAANGDRLTETASGTTTGFYYNGPQIIERRQGGTVTSQNVFNIDYVNDMLLRDDNSTSGSLGKSSSGLGERLFVQHDANFNVTALTNTSGVVQERFVYSPYGTVTVLSPSWTSTTDSFGWGYLFQGMWQDPVTGLYYTPNRDYSAVMGVWAEPDPAGDINGVDLYAIEEANPSSQMDPTGLATEQGSPASQPATRPYGNIFHPYPGDSDPNKMFAPTSVSQLLFGDADKPTPTIDLPPEIEAAQNEAIRRVQAGIKAGNFNEWGGVVSLEDPKAANPDYKVWGPVEGNGDQVDVSAALPSNLADHANRDVFGMYHVHPNAQIFSRIDIELFLNRKRGLAPGEKERALGFSLLSDCDGMNSWLVIGLKGTTAGAEGERLLTFSSRVLVPVSEDANYRDSYRKNRLPALEASLLTNANRLGFALYRRVTRTGPFLLLQFAAPATQPATRP